MLRRPVFRLAIVACSIASTGAAQRTDARIAKLKALMGAYASLGDISGVVLVAERGRVLMRRAVGYSDREFDITARPEHRFVIGSITKGFTAVLTLQQVARGRIALDTPVVRYWPEFPDPSNGDITIRHLLTHRSGFKHWGAVQGFFDGAARMPQSQADVIRLYAAKGLTFPPGTREDYSSIGYMILGVVLEKVTGTPFGTLLQKEIFEPARMTSSSLDDAVSILPGRARPYRYNFLEARYDNAEQRDPSTTWSTGGVVTTVDDLLRWSEALSSNTLLPDSLRALIFDRREGDAWYGWRIDSLPGGVRSFWHVGLETGFRSQIVRIPSRGQTIVVLGNVRDLDTDRISQRILKILAGGSPDLPKRSIAKALYRAARAAGGDSAAALFRMLVRRPQEYDTTQTQALIAAIELRSDKACDRAAPVYEAWLDVYPESRGRITALIGAADCRLLLGNAEKARAHVERLAQLDPTNTNLAELRRRLAR
ncbi:MAG TPA: serine hydrolase [Gemmatimonadaceae bacterium]|nr:serine hydrolase [Gemmatimonadaceae bacterium]